MRSGEIRSKAVSLDVTDGNTVGWGGPPPEGRVFRGDKGHRGRGVTTWVELPQGPSEGGGPWATRGHQKVREQGKVKGHRTGLGALWDQGHLTGSPGIPAAPGSPCGKHRGGGAALQHDRPSATVPCAGLSAARAATR